MIRTSRFVLAAIVMGLLWLIALPSNAQMYRWGGGGGGGMGGGGMTGTTLTTFETADFSGSGACAFCHSQLTDSTGKDVSIDAHWRSTMMANAAKDPLWQAKISSEVKRTPGLQAAIEEKCSRCHMGMARYQDLTNGTSEGKIKVLGTGYLASTHPLHAAAMDGISCTLCHQVQPESLGTEAVFTGQYAIDTSTSTPYRLAFGPYDQPVQNPMEMHSGFSPVPGDHVAGSALCSPCHTLYTPYVDASGTVKGEFPEQTTYLEWEHSGRVKSCQGCHMPDAGSVVISNRPWWLSPRSPFGQHHFVGANSFMVNLIKSNAATLGATADPAHFDATIARTDTMLQSRTGGLDLVSTSLESGVLNFTLKVQNMAGHKFPSGIPARRAWLHVTVTDSKNRVVFESGKPQDDGSIIGNDADIDASKFEPHYDVINSADQVQIYEPVMDDSDGNVTYTLLRAAAYAKDNRLIPSGFAKSSASSDIAVVGDAAGDSNFIAGEDQITYQVQLSNAPSGTLTVKAELLYQAVSYRFARDLSRDSTDLVMRFKSMYDAAGKVPKLVATVQTSL
jgi:hypothetical protein